MAQNFKAWSVIDSETGDFVVAILVAPDFAGLPDIPLQFRKRAHNHAKLVEGIPATNWVRWILDHWEARSGQPPTEDDSDDVPIEA